MGKLPHAGRSIDHGWIRGAHGSRATDRIRAATVGVVNSGATFDPVQTIALTAALVVAVVLVVAAGTKLKDPQAAADEFAALGLAAAPALARIVPGLELATAAVLLVAPGWGGTVAFALLIGFTTVLVTTIVRWPRGTPRPGCACFGGSSLEPIGPRHLIRNLGLLVLSGLATLFEGTVGSVLV